ncbi:hypothetical protein B0H16DRAFT_1457876 [Mycena metata]|uniref:Uncharacterized protein n=1 Tax=Mycena metata TaxID=1033252 RepID=A0AAD7ND72_9AGAR|nr:hypothetical protein B0H16DRAFT_1457876 [Mycena metata]
MLAFLSFWRRDDESSTLPVASKERSRRVDKASIGQPVLRFIPPRFEIYATECPREPLTRTSSHRSGSLPSPSSPAPLSARSTPPAREQCYPLIRSYSLPTPVCPPLSTADENVDDGFSASPIAARANSFSPLHVNIHTPLSPILENCASPVSIKPTSPKDSEISTLDLPRPAVLPPTFMQRSLSKSHTIEDPPSLPALNLAPYFPGPHPSQDGNGPPRRPPRALILPVRSSVYSEGARSSSGSLHAESFVTASNSLHIPGDPDPTPPPDSEPPAAVARSVTSISTIPISHSPVHLERHNTPCSTTAAGMRLKRQHLTFATPAFCAFCLGFLFPPIWWVGGWYFTFFAETPPSRTLWEHYVVDTRWWGVLTCGRSRKARKTRATCADPTMPKPLLLPLWVGRNNTRASLKGISYYYPYVSRPAPGEKGHVTTGPPPLGFRYLHAFFDWATGSRLDRVKRDWESPRRIIDPWIQRCRRALCYWCLALLLVVLAVMAWSIAVGSGKAHY